MTATPPEIPSGAPCWVDVLSSDLDRAQRFYGELFGWTAERAAEDYGGYSVFSKDGHRVAGCMSNVGLPAGHETWTVYLRTTDLDATLAAVAANGGQIAVPAAPLGGLGRMAVIADSAGAILGVWEPGRHRGFDVLGGVGAPTYFEVWTRDYPAAVTFYRDVFEWDVHTMSDTPEFRYATLGEGPDARAGIYDASNALAEGRSPYWTVYFGVEDTDAALRTIEKLGGTVLAEAEDTPYGRLATAADPTGAAFRIGSMAPE